MICDCMLAREREREREPVGLFLSSAAVSDVLPLWVISLLRLIDLQTAEHRNKVQEKKVNSGSADLRRENQTKLWA